MTDEAPTPRTATSADVQARFECSQSTVSTWVKDGCPHEKTPRPGGGRPLTLFNLNEVAAWVKVTQRNISATGGGDHKSFVYRHGGTGKDTKAAVADLDIAQQRAKLRKDLAAAATAELKLEEMRGLLVSTEDVKLESLAKIARARSVLLGGPAVLAQDTVGDPEHDEALLSEWVHRALKELSTEEA